MKVRQGDRRHQESLWRRLLGWLLRERRDGWEQRARPVTVGLMSGDRRHSQAQFYDAVVDRRKGCDEPAQESAVPALPGTVRADVDEAAPVERERQEQEGGGDAKHVS